MASTFTLLCLSCLVIVLVPGCRGNSCTTTKECYFNKPEKHKHNASAGEFSTYKTRKSECALLLIDSQKTTTDSLGSNATGVAQFLYTPSILQDKPYGTRLGIVYNTSCPKGQLAYFELLELDMEDHTEKCEDYLRIYAAPSTPHHIAGQDINSSGTPLIGEISHLVFRSNNNNNGARQGFKGYLQCFSIDLNMKGCANGSSGEGQPHNSSHLPQGKDWTDLHQLRNSSFRVAVLNESYSDGDVLLALGHEDSCNSVLRALAKAVVHFMNKIEPARLRSLRPTTTSPSKVVRPIDNIGECSPMSSELTFCSSMVWKNVSFPNWKKQKTQKEAAEEIAEYRLNQLVELNCSVHIRHLICAYYAPVCPNGNRIPLKPCRAWCDQVASTCRPILEFYKHPIPEFLQCSNFPMTQPCFFIPPGSY